MTYSPRRTDADRRSRYALGVGGSLLIHAALIYILLSGPSPTVSSRYTSEHVELSITAAPRSGFPTSTDETSLQLPGSLTIRNDNRRPRLVYHREAKASVVSVSALPEEEGSTTPASEISRREFSSNPVGPPNPTKDALATIPLTQDEAAEMTKHPSVNSGPFDRRIPVLFPSTRSEKSSAENEDMSASAVRNREQATPKSVRDELGIPEPGSGQGEFDFYSPFDFKKEMAEAREKIATDNMKFEHHKNTDRGYGVVCNTGDGWFMCAESAIATCNKKHQNLCRFAEKNEFEKLSEEIFF